MHAPLIEAFRNEDAAFCARMMRDHVEHFAKWEPNGPTSPRRRSESGPVRVAPPPDLPAAGRFDVTDDSETFPVEDHR